VAPAGEPGQLAVEFSQPCHGLVEGGLAPAALQSELGTLLTACEASETSGQFGELRVEGFEAGPVICQAGGELFVEVGQVLLPSDVGAGQEGFKLRDPDTQWVRRLGHASISITLDVYGHCLPADDEAAAATVAAAILGSPG